MNELQTTFCGYTVKEIKDMEKTNNEMRQFLSKHELLKENGNLLGRMVEDAKTISQLKARIARLEQACELYDVELGNMGISCPEADAVANESPQQSLAAVQADAVEDFLHNRDVNWRGSDFSVFATEYIERYIETLRQQGDI